MRALGEIARRFKQHGELSGDARRLQAMMLDERLRHPAAEHRPPRRLQRCLEHVLIEDVDELVSRVSVRSGNSYSLPRLDKDVHPLEDVETLLDIRWPPFRLLR